MCAFRTRHVLGVKASVSPGDSVPTSPSFGLAHALSFPGPRRAAFGSRSSPDAGEGVTGSCGRDRRPLPLHADGIQCESRAGEALLLPRPTPAGTSSRLSQGGQRSHGRSTHVPLTICRLTLQELDSVVGTTVSNPFIFEAGRQGGAGAAGRVLSPGGRVSGRAAPRVPRPSHSQHPAFSPAVTRASTGVRFSCY